MKQFDKDLENGATQLPSCVVDRLLGSQMFTRRAKNQRKGRLRKIQNSGELARWDMEYCMAFFSEMKTQAEIFERGVRLFNSESFFSAHETLEDVWRDAPDPQKKFLQGMIQAAVAFHHFQNGNVVGCQSLLKRSIEKLGTFPDTYGGIDSGGLLRALVEWQQRLSRELGAPGFPKIILMSEDSHSPC